MLATLEDIAMERLAKLLLRIVLIPPIALGVSSVFFMAFFLEDTATRRPGRRPSHEAGTKAYDR
jgi:hypothetical protein